MANNLLDPVWVAERAALEDRQKREAASAARKAVNKGTTVLRRSTVRPSEESFPVYPFYTTAATDYLIPSRSGEAGTGVVVSPLAQDPFYTTQPSSTVASLLGGDAVMSMTRNALGEVEEREQARAEAVARQADEDARAIQSGTPRGSSLLGLDAGEKKANEKNQAGFLSGLLGSVDWQGLLKVFARPEFLQSGISPAQAFVNSAFAQRQAEAGAAAEQQKQMLELQKEVIKKSGTDAQKLTGPVVDVVNNTATASEGLEAINQYRKILSEAQVGGIGAKLDETVNSVASLFGFGGLTPAQKSQAIRQRVLASLQTAQAKGQISQADYANIEQQLSQPGKWFTNSEALNEQLSLIQSQLQSKLNLGRNTLKYFGLDPAQLSPYSNTPLFSSKRPG